MDQLDVNRPKKDSKSYTIKFKIDLKWTKKELKRTQNGPGINKKTRPKKDKKFDLKWT